MKQEKVRIRDRKYILKKIFAIHQKVSKIYDMDQAIFTKEHLTSHIVDFLNKIDVPYKIYDESVYFIYDKETSLIMYIIAISDKLHMRTIDTILFNCLKGVICTYFYYDADGYIMESLREKLINRYNGCEELFKTIYSDYFNLSLVNCKLKKHLVFRRTDKFNKNKEKLREVYGKYIYNCDDLEPPYIKDFDVYKKYK